MDHLATHHVSSFYASLMKCNGQSDVPSWDDGDVSELAWEV